MPLESGHDKKRISPRKQAFFLCPKVRVTIHNIEKAVLKRCLKIAVSVLWLAKFYYDLMKWKTARTLVLPKRPLHVRVPIFTGYRRQNRMRRYLRDRTLANRTLKSLTASSIYYSTIDACLAYRIGNIGSRSVRPKQSGPRYWFPWMFSRPKVSAKMQSGRTYFVYLWKSFQWFMLNL